MNENTKKQFNIVEKAVNQINHMIGESDEMSEYTCALINLFHIIQRLEDESIMDAKRIADSINSLSHEDLTALSHLMWVRKNEIEKERRAYLEGK